MSNSPPEILQYFAHDHLPPHLAEVSRPFAELAHTICETLPGSAERTVALRKLLEAKDAAVRAKLYKPREDLAAPPPAPPPTPMPAIPRLDMGDGAIGHRHGDERPHGSIGRAFNLGPVGAWRAVGVWQKGTPPTPLEASRAELLVELGDDGSWRWLGPWRAYWEGALTEDDLERIGKQAGT